MKKYLRATEYAWLILSILCVCVTTYYFIIGMQDEGVVAMMITLFTGIMYNMRRRFNRMMERANQKQEAEKPEQNSK